MRPYRDALRRPRPLAHPVGVVDALGRAEEGAVAVASVAVVVPVTATASATAPFATGAATVLTIPTTSAACVVAAPIVAAPVEAGCAIVKKKAIAKTSSLCVVSIRAAELDIVVHEKAGGVVERTALGWILASQ